jgi:hypothetical protein
MKTKQPKCVGKPDEPENVGKHHLADTSKEIKPEPAKGLRYPKISDLKDNTMIKVNGEWVKAIPEPYYPNLIERILCLVGIHGCVIGERGNKHTCYRCDKIFFKKKL